MGGGPETRAREQAERVRLRELYFKKLHELAQRGVAYDDARCAELREKVSDVVFKYWINQGF